MPEAEKTELPPIDPAVLRIFHDDSERLRMTVEGSRSYLTVKPAWAAPLTRPNTYLALLDGKGDEIVTLPDPNVLSKDSLAAIEKELRYRYLTATVSRINHTKQEFGASYWEVETDRGSRDFVAQSLQENAQWLSANHLLLIDVDGNRFEIPDIAKLDEDSVKRLREIV